MTTTDFITDVHMFPAYDHREESHNKGCGSATLVFILRGPDAVLTMDVFTEWMSRPLKLPYLSIKGTPPPWPRTNKPGPDAGWNSPMPATMSLHCSEQRKDWWPEGRECVYLDGATCYGDIGYTVSDHVFDLFVSEGSDAGFAEMKEIYLAWMAPDEDEP